MKLVEIPIRRFQPEVPLTRDTFLFLPLNNKTIRIGVAGEAIPETLLARILSKGHTHLRIHEEADVDPENFPVHAQEPAIEAQALPPVEETHLKSSVAAAEGETIIPSGTASTEEQTILAASPPPKIEEGKILSGAPAAEEPEQSFSTEEEEKETSVVKGGEEGEEPATSISGLMADEDNEETRLASDDEKEQESQTISGKQEEEEKYVRKFAPEKEALSAVIRLQKKMAEKADSELSIDLSSEKDSALKEARSVILSSKISEKIIEMSEQARTAEPKLRDSLRGQVRGLKVALDQVDAGDLRIEEKAEPETKEEITAVAESLASASHAEQVEEITERLSAHALTRELAMAALEEQEEEGEGESELLRSATSRDLPATVSRLAAYLGHSLGYTNIDFLADLACGAIAHFAKKEGEALDEDLLPPFAKRIISPGDPSHEETVIDSREILQFLDAYIEDKECDRSHRDLMKRVFDRTLKEFAERDDGPSILSLKKWSSFVDRGPTMDSHSICTRASAKAIKYARSAAK